MNDTRHTHFYPSSGLYHVSLRHLMGTRLDALLLGSDPTHLESVWATIETELRRMEKMLNRFDPESEIAQVNAQATFTAVRLSDELWDILQDCRQYHARTAGYFDVALSHFNQLIWMEASQSILFNKYGMRLDFGGYAKGYAMRCVRKHLIEEGVQCALINFGDSAVLAVGTHPHGDCWPVGIAYAQPHETQTTIQLRDNALSVSGNTPAHVPHIVNPKNRQWITSGTKVAVVADDPLDAEVLTTAWIASGEEETPAWMEAFTG